MTLIDTHFPAGPAPQTLRSLVSHGPSPHAAEPLLAGQSLAHLRVDRVHFPGAKPVQLHITAQTEAGDRQVIIGQWVGDGAEDMARDENARLAKARRGQASPDGTTAIAADPVHGLVLRRPGFDTRLPGLRLLHDPAFAADTLPRLGLDPGAALHLVAHRLGKRAVLRITGAHGTCYARLRPVTSTSGAEAYARHHALWSALQGETRLAIPRPLAFDKELGLALFDTLPGSRPQFHGLDGFRATDAVIRATAALQSQSLALTIHTAEDELALLDDWAMRLAPVYPAIARALATPLAQLRDDLISLPVLPPVPCHRDLHEGQILLNEGRAGLLDFDTLRLSDPALDIGNLQAHLILATLRGDTSARAFVTAMDNALPHLSLRRIAVWRRAALLRLAAIYAFSALPRRVIHALIAESASC
jgi:hypothetical protein